MRLSRSYFFRFIISSLLFLLFPSFPPHSSSFFYHAVKLRFRVAAGSIKPRVRYYLVFIVLVKSMCARRCAFVYVSPRKSGCMERVTNRERRGGGGRARNLRNCFEKSLVCRARSDFWRSNGIIII